MVGGALPTNMAGHTDAREFALLRGPCLLSVSSPPSWLLHLIAALGLR